MVLALRNPGKFKSVSAFAPICNPSEVPWGIKAFTGEYSITRKTRGPEGTRMLFSPCISVTTCM